MEMETKINKDGEKSLFKANSRQRFFMVTGN